MAVWVLSRGSEELERPSRSHQPILHERRSEDGGSEGFQPYNFPCRTGGFNTDRWLDGQRATVRRANFAGTAAAAGRRDREPERRVIRRGLKLSLKDPFHFICRYSHVGITLIFNICLLI